MALWLQARDESPGLILHSPYRRTTQSATVLAGVHEARTVSVRPAPWLAPGAGDLAAALTESLRRVSHERVAVVGHPPEVGQAAALLTGGSHIAFSPGTVACIRFEGVLQPGHGTLQWLLAASLFHSDG